MTRFSTWLRVVCVAVAWMSMSCVPTTSSPNGGSDTPADNSNSAPTAPTGDWSDLPDGDEPVLDPVAEFSIPDVNPESPRFGQSVSPRDYLGQISAWYFGHAT